MKKLIFALAAVATVFAVNAAETKWKFSTGTGVLYDGYKNTGASTYTKAEISGATLYLIDAASTTQDALVKAYLGAEGTVDLGSYAVKGSAASGGTEAAISIKTDASGKNTAGNTFFNASDFTGGTTYNFYMAALVDGSLFVSQTLPKAAQDPSKTTGIAISESASSIVFNKDATGFVNAGWYTVSVPEPTSGLLLLLGVAGMALRRRRA